MKPKKEIIADKLNIDLEDEDDIEEPTNGIVTTNIPTEQEVIDTIVPALNNPLPHAKEDYEFTRATMKETIIKGTKALEDALAVAKEEGKSRSYEVVGGLLKTMSDISKTYFNLQHENKELQKISDVTGKGSINIEQGIVYAGSGGDQLRYMKEKLKAKKEENDD